jgi:hypothetical protein
MTLSDAKKREALMVTMWLTLYALALSERATGDVVGKKLGMLWYPLHMRDNSLHLVFPEMFDGGSAAPSGVKVELARFLIVGFTQVTAWREDAPLWSITELGISFLKQSWGNVKHVVSPVVEDQWKAVFEK